MKTLLTSAKLLLLDLASMVLFLIVFIWTKNVTFAVVAAMMLGSAQIGWQIFLQKPIDTMQWMSLVLVLGSGAATLLTADPRFVMLKPSVIYAVVGVVMLKRGWMSRYLPPVAVALVPDIAILFGYLWAVLMFFSALLNIVVALRFDVATWAWFMSIYGIVSKIALFLISFVIMRIVAKRRRAAGIVTAGV